MVVLASLFILFSFKYQKDSLIYHEDSRQETTILRHASELSSTDNRTELSDHVSAVKSKQKLVISKIKETLPSTDTLAKTTPAEAIPIEYHPYKRILYTSGQNDNRTVFVVPRRAYYDTRKDYSGKPRGVVILAQAHDDACNSVVACESNGFYTRIISVTCENVQWARRNMPGHTHRAMLIECRGLPPQAIVNGSFPKLIYKKSGESYYSIVRCEQALVLKNFSSTPARGKGSVVVCTPMFDHPPLFDVWLKYQKTIGVDGVHLNTDPSFIRDAKTYTFFNESKNNGFVQVDVWNAIVGNRIFYHGQVTKLQDCIYRHIDMFEYVLIYDADDYFTPLVPGQNKVHYYLKKFFSSSNMGSVCMTWRDMQCAPEREKLYALQDGNLTSILSGYDYMGRIQAKCAHRVDALQFVLVHRHQSLLPGFTTKPAGSIAYVAHNRHGTKLCNS